MLAQKNAESGYIYTELKMGLEREYGAGNRDGNGDRAEAETGYVRIIVAVEMGKMNVRLAKDNTHICGAAGKVVDGRRASDPTCDDWRLANEDQRPETGDRRQATGDTRA